MSGDRMLPRPVKTALKVLFWCALAAEVLWLVLATAAEEAVSSVLGLRDQGFVHLLILGSLALSSGVFVLLESYANNSNESEHHWTLSETLYLLVLFGSLFFGIYAFFGWWFSG